MKRVLPLKFFLTHKAGIPGCGAQNVRNAGLGEQSSAVESGVRGRFPELPRKRVGLEHTFRDPDSRELQDISVLERDFHVTRDAIRCRIGTFGQGKGDAVLLVEEGWGALALERELRAFEIENRVGRRVQMLFGRAASASGSGRL